MRSCGAVRVVLEKGTLDALSAERDKHALVDEALRVLGEGGVLVSISFRSALRVQPTPATHFERKAGEKVCASAFRNRSIKGSIVRL